MLVEDEPNAIATTTAPITLVGPCNDRKMSAALAMAVGVSIMKLDGSAPISAETLEPICKEGRERAKDFSAKLSETPVDTDEELLRNSLLSTVEFGADARSFCTGVLPRDATKLISTFSMYAVHEMRAAVIFLYPEASAATTAWTGVALLFADDAHHRYGYCNINKGIYYPLPDIDDGASRVLTNLFKGETPMRFVARIVQSKTVVVAEEESESDGASEPKRDDDDGVNETKRPRSPSPAPPPSSSKKAATSLTRKTVKSSTPASRTRAPSSSQTPRAPPKTTPNAVVEEME